jgi:mannan endo-1,6-alpha-mannosidase
MWGSRVQQILNGLTSGFFPQQYGGGKVMVEIECEPSGVCNNDERSFKAYLARWMALTAQLAPFTAGTIIPLLQSSSVAAAGQCIGGNNGRMCGQQWYSSTWDGSSGVGQQVSNLSASVFAFRNADIGSQMAALSAIGTNLLTPAMVPLTKSTGGNSVSDPNAGNTSPNTQPGITTKPITTSDRAGAGILTFLIIVGVIGGAWWINIE